MTTSMAGLRQYLEQFDNLSDGESEQFSFCFS